ncbi:MAG: WD40 repeat domain-containing protein [Spirochaetes bacterium]|jgi:WD40 repeat protein|nr:WD40 repeat domain-containing protein [Spirochaetota bacterium]
MSGLIGQAPRYEFAVDGYVQCLLWSANSDRLCVASAEGEVAMFDMANGHRLWRVDGHALGTASIALATEKDVVASVGQDTQLRVYEAAGGRVVATALLPGWGERVSFSPNGKNLAAAAGREVLIFAMDDLLAANGEQCSPVRRFGPHQSTVTDITWDPRDPGRLAATAYGGISLWLVHAQDDKTRDPERRYEWQGSSLVAEWSPDGRFIATGDQDATVHFWFAASGIDLQMWGFPSKVLELSWDHTSRYLATGGSASPTLWDCDGPEGPRGRTPKELSVHSEHVRALVFSHQTQLLASGDAAGLLALWTPVSSRKPVEQRGALYAVTALAFAPNDRALAVGYADGSVVMYDVFL